MGEMVSSGARKIAEEMIAEVKEAAKQSDGIKPAGDIAQGPKFDDTMGTQKLAGISQTTTPPDIMQLLKTAKDALSASDAGLKVPSVGSALNTHPFMSGMHRVIDQIANGQNKLEQIVKLSLSGQNLSSQEILALQAAVYRFSQELDLTSKVVQQGTATIKQTLNTQV